MIKQAEQAEEMDSRNRNAGDFLAGMELSGKNPLFSAPVFRHCAKPGAWSRGVE